MASTANGHSNGMYTYDSFAGNKRKSDTHFLWWCAGAHQSLLKELPSEQTKQAGLGGVILATFVLAALSAGWAIYSVFNDWIWAFVFGVIWGLIIFNFDRFLVSTMRKYGVSARKQFWTAFPRIVLALLIGITIARPLELKIFEKEIDVKVMENRHKRILHNDSLLQAENNQLVSGAEQERSRLMTRKIFIESELTKLQNDYVQEADGTGGSQQIGIKNLTLMKQDAYNKALLEFQPELQKLAGQIQYQDSLLSNSKAILEGKRKQYEADLATKVGFLERNKALSDLSNQESSVFWTSFFISLLIILIETGPILSKMIMNVGPYDLALAKMELMKMAETENEMKRDKELIYDRLSELYKKKKESSDEVLDKLHNLQKKQIDEELERWERGERVNLPRSTMEDLVKKIREQYQYNEEQVL